MSEISRRRLLAAGVGAAAGVAAGVTIGAQRASAAYESATFGSNPFALGVASGDAFTTSVCLWTRVAPQPTQSGYGMNGQTGPITVRWRIALTSADLASDGTSVDYGAFDSTSTDAHSVHVIAGNLAPGTHYVYQFRYNDPSGTVWKSSIGHTRTTPAHTTAENMRFAVVSCQNIGRYGSPRYFNGYDYMVDNNAALDLDFVLQIGDYIYADLTAQDQNWTCSTLPDYRLRYGKYRMARSNLREIHRLKPFYCTPDDHEWWNNVRGGVRDFSAKTVDGHTFEQFNWAMRAYWEHTPTRYRPVLDSASGLRYAHFNRNLQWGSLLFMHLTDIRQFRTASGTGSGATLLGIDPYFDHSHYPRQDLLDAIYNSTTTWNCVATQVPMGKIVDKPDKWMSYSYERNLITDALSNARVDGTVPNAVVVSGDIHCPVVGQVDDRNGAFVATEFVGPSMTSGDTKTLSANGGSILKVYTDSSDRVYHGFLLCDVTADHFDAAYYLGLNVTDSSATVSEFVTWRRVPGTVKPTQL